MEDQGQEHFGALSLFPLHLRKPSRRLSLPPLLRSIGQLEERIYVLECPKHDIYNQWTRLLEQSFPTCSTLSHAACRQYRKDWPAGNDLECSSWDRGPEFPPPGIGLLHSASTHFVRGFLGGNVTRYVTEYNSRTLPLTLTHVSYIK
jgi:hypothetical protein